jgi:hypothetical protein
MRCAPGSATSGRPFEASSVKPLSATVNAGPLAPRHDGATEVRDRVTPARALDHARPVPRGGPSGSSARRRDDPGSKGSSPLASTYDPLIPIRQVARSSEAESGRDVLRHRLTRCLGVPSNPLDEPHGQAQSHRLVPRGRSPCSGSWPTVSRQQIPTDPAADLDRLIGVGDSLSHSSFSLSARSLRR